MVRIYAYSRNFGVKNVHNLKKNQNHLFFEKNKPCWDLLQRIPERCTLGWLRCLPFFWGGGRFPFECQGLLLGLQPYVNAATSEDKTKINEAHSNLPVRALTISRSAVCYPLQYRRAPDAPVQPCPEQLRDQVPQSHQSVGACRGNSRLFRVSVGKVRDLTHARMSQRGILLYENLTIFSQYEPIGTFVKHTVLFSGPELYR